MAPLEPEPPTDSAVEYLPPSALLLLEPPVPPPPPIDWAIIPCAPSPSVVMAVAALTLTVLATPPFPPAPPRAKEAEIPSSSLPPASSSSLTAPATAFSAI